jgi:RimJ/RimL family protein N-acetyltransferase
MNVLRANGLVLTVDEQNIGSCKLAEGAGFGREGTHRDADFGPDGERRSLRVYAKAAA